MASYTAPLFDLSRMAAVASTASLLAFPRISQIATVTRGVLRIRLTFHESPSVMTNRRSPSGAAQITVDLARPSFVNVVSRMYLALATSAKVGAIAHFYCTQRTLVYAPSRLLRTTSVRSARGGAVSPR